MANGCFFWPILLDWFSAISSCVFVVRYLPCLATTGLVGNSEGDEVQAGKLLIVDSLQIKFCVACFSDVEIGELDVPLMNPNSPRVDLR